MAIRLIPRELNGVIISQREDNGYVNITELAKAYYQSTETRRDVSSWLNLERTKESMKHLSENTGIPVFSLVEVKQGRNGSTWIHPNLSVRFAIWLSDEFGFAVEVWVRDWFNSRIVGENDINRIEARRQLKDEYRLYLTDQVKNHLERIGENDKYIYANVHNAINLAITGETAKQMRERTGLKSSELLRDYFPLDKLVLYCNVTINAANNIIDGMEPVEAVRRATCQSLPRNYKPVPIQLEDPICVLQKKLVDQLVHSQGYLRLTAR